MSNISNYYYSVDANLQNSRRRECREDVDDVSTGAEGLSRTAAERIVMKDSVKSTTCFLADVMATAPAAMSLSYKQTTANLLE